MACKYSIMGLFPCNSKAFNTRALPDYKFLAILDMLYYGLYAEPYLMFHNITWTSSVEQYLWKERIENKYIFNYLIMKIKSAEMLNRYKINKEM